jgi:4-hydroxybutyrate CoA-transferase
MNVFVQGGCTEPSAIIDAIRAQPERSRGVHYIVVPTPGLNRTDFAGLTDETTASTFFVTPEMQASFAAGRTRYIPSHYSGIEPFLRGRRIDLAIASVGPPGPDGLCSVGPTGDFTPLLATLAERTIAEVNAAMPAGIRGPKIAPDRLHAAVHADHPLASMPRPAVTPDLKAIGELVAGLVRDGDTLQIGVGRLPAIILSALAAHRDLGIHSGIIGNSVLDLIERGVVTNARKPLDAGISVVGNAVGDEALYGNLAAWPIEFRPGREIQRPDVLAWLPNFVSINSAVEVDLFGQANAEMAGGRIISGSGGFVDFVRGAAWSEGGRSVIALESTAKRGTRSRIVPALAPDVAATGLRADLDYVVTEHGVARLRGLSLGERAKALIAIAAPEFRDALSASALARAS